MWIKMSSVCLTLHENVCVSLQVCVNFTSVKPQQCESQLERHDEKKKAFLKKNDDL